MKDMNALVERYSRPVPRYTSYPTAPHFSGEFDASNYERWLSEVDRNKPVSVYVHIPFCDKLCWFCGCHTRHTLRYDPVRGYLKSLHREMELVGKALGFKPLLGQLHFGGGSPSLLKSWDMEDLRDGLAKVFHISENAQISMEIDPSDATCDMYEGMHALGVNRASIGVQDFDETVQRAINRPQSFEDTARTVDALRGIGIPSVNIDALYGLPHQTLQSLERTIQDVITLDPDRIALFGYAHVPWMKKHQQMIDEQHLPDIHERFSQARRAEEMLREAGYRQIGIDHFAKPGDGLFEAAASGEVGRNFQGYTDDPCDTLIGLGASSIGRTEQGYVQNVVATGQYQAMVSDGHLPVAKGLNFTDDDKARGYFINQLMTDFSVDLVKFRNLFPSASGPVLREAAIAVQTDRDGLCEINGDVFRIMPDSEPFVRTVASWFDAYLADHEGRYSTAL